MVQRFLDDLVRAGASPDADTQTQAEWLALWLELVQEADPDFDLEPPAIIEALHDPWCRQPDGVPNAAAQLVSWIRSRREARSSALAARMQSWIAQHPARDPGFARLQVIWCAPLMEAADLIELHSAQRGSSFGLNALTRADLLTADEVYRFKAHRVVGEAFQSLDALLDGLQHDYARLGPLADFSVENLRAFLDAEALAPEFLDACAQVHRPFDAKARATLADVLHPGSDRVNFLKDNVYTLMLDVDRTAPAQHERLQQRWERALVLMAPLADPAELVQIFALDGFGRRNSSWTDGRHMRDLANDLRAGDGIYADIGAALRHMDVNWSPIVDEFSGPRSAGPSLQRLLATLVLIGFGQRVHRDEPDWWFNLTVSLGFGRIELPECSTQLLQPLMSRFTSQSDEAIKALQEIGPEAVSNLWYSLGLDEAAMANAGFHQAMKQLPGYAQMMVPPEVAQKHPEVWLDHAQWAWTEAGQFSDRGVRTPDAIAWYRSLAGQTAVNARLAVLQCLAEIDGDEKPSRPGDEPLTPVKELGFRGLERLLTHPNPPLRREAAKRIGRMFKHEVNQDAAADRPDWGYFVELTRAHPDALGEFRDAGERGADEYRRWAVIWELAPKQRPGVASDLLQAILHVRKDRDVALETAAQLMLEHEDTFFRAADNFRDSEAQELARYLAADREPLRRLVPRLCIVHRSRQRMLGDKEVPLDAELLNLVMEEHPEELARVDRERLVHLVHDLTDTAVIACGDNLQALIRARSIDGLPLWIVRALSRVSVSALESSGLVESDDVNVRRVVNYSLALSVNDDARNLTRARIDDPINDDYLRGLMLDALEAGGLDVADLDAGLGQSQDELIAAAGDSTNRKQASQVWTPAVAECLAELGEPVARFALGQVQDDHPPYGLARSVRQIFDQVSTNCRADLT